MIRTIALWCPDWPVTALISDEKLDPASPIALIDRGVVFACSERARAEGVRRGIRVREAQARCPGLTVAPYDPLLDARIFEPVVTAIEDLMPGVQLLRPGTCVLRARGPSRFYGSEHRAAEALLFCLESLGIGSARVGIADGPFAAEHAARTSGGDRVRIIQPGRSAEFLAPYPVSVLDDPPLVTLLRRLGIHTLGAFAELPALDVLGRFGQGGAQAHALASGQDYRRVVPRTPPALFDLGLDFEPPLDRIDSLAFGVRSTVDEFLERLSDAGLVCTELGVEIRTDRGEESSRTWQHPRWFTAADIVDRVRWQLGGSEGLSSPVNRVNLIPERTDAAGNHEAGLWGGGPDESIHHGLSRVQGVLGHEAVTTAVVAGGRALADRAVQVAWGDRAPGNRIPVGTAEGRTWPGSLPPPAPASVFPNPLPVTVLGRSGVPVDVDARGVLTDEPVLFCPTGSRRQQIAAWAGPWPVEERWWDSDQARYFSRFQMVDADGMAWLLVLEGSSWWAEAKYD
jgi:protein ImuB